MTAQGPWFDPLISSLVAAQLATREGHIAIAGHWRTVAEQTAQIAAQHEALAAVLPEAVQASADLAAQATVHHSANVQTILRGEQDLNKLRDAQVDALARKIDSIEAKIDQLLRGRCAACPHAPLEDDTGNHDYTGGS